MIIAAGIILATILGMLGLGCAAVYEETKEAGQPISSLAWAMLLSMFLSIAAAFLTGRFG